MPKKVHIILINWKGKNGREKYANNDVIFEIIICETYWMIYLLHKTIIFSNYLGRTKNQLGTSDQMCLFVYRRAP